jgi:hypothetical protein
MNQELQLLRKDFIRFSQLHSWYKHLPLEGIPFYFYKRTGQQSRHPIDPMVDDEVGEHYHFVRMNSEISEKHAVRFGPFLRGDGYGMELIGYGEEDKKRVKEWVAKEYPVLYQKREEISTLLHENMGKPYDEVRYLFRKINQIDEEIFSSEREKYWNELVSVYHKVTVT